MLVDTQSWLLLGDFVQMMKNDLTIKTHFSSCWELCYDAENGKFPGKKFKSLFFG